MSETNTICLKCRGEMTEDFTLEIGAYDSNTQDNVDQKQAGICLLERP